MHAIVFEIVIDEWQLSVCIAAMMCRLDLDPGEHAMRRSAEHAVGRRFQHLKTQCELPADAITPAHATASQPRILFETAQPVALFLTEPHGIELIGERAQACEERARSLGEGER
jgi:hypothetical protein